jgi:hypothetical protein
VFAVNLSFYAVGIADEQREANAWFIHKALVKPAMFAKEETLVGSINDQSVIGPGLLYPESLIARPILKSTEAIQRRYP